MTTSTGRSSKKKRKKVLKKTTATEALQLYLHHRSPAAEIVFHLSLDELTLLHLTLKHFNFRTQTDPDIIANRLDRPKDEELGLSLALRLHSFLASERTRRADEIH